MMAKSVYLIPYVCFQEIVEENRRREEELKRIAAASAASSQRASSSLSGNGGTNLGGAGGGAGGAGEPGFVNSALTSIAVVVCFAAFAWSVKYVLRTLVE